MLEDSTFPFEILDWLQSVETASKWLATHLNPDLILFVIKTEDIAWFYRDEYVFLMTHSKQRYILDYSLDQLIELLNPKYFYRLNRQFIVHLDAISRMETFFNHKLKITLNPKAEVDVFVAKDRVKIFKNWLG